MDAIHVTTRHYKCSWICLKADVGSYLQLVCLAENVKLDLDDVNTLLKVTRGDVRRCLLQLQLWANSGGGLPKCPRSQQCKLYFAIGFDYKIV